MLALEAFAKVKESCFGMELLPSFKSDIQEFKRCYDLLGINVINKVHVLVDHVPEFCERKQKALGYFTEQASEAVHCDFKTTWKYYQVSEENEKFPEKLLAAVLKYNAKHL